MTYNNVMSKNGFFGIFTKSQNAHLLMIMSISSNTLLSDYTIDYIHRQMIIQLTILLSNDYTIDYIQMVI